MNPSPTMTEFAQVYLDYRRHLGFDLKTVGQLLLQFAEYADQTGHDGPVTAELAIGWAALAESASGAHRAYRLSVVRNFAQYRALFDPQTEIPPSDVFGPRYRRKAPYIFSATELADFLKAAKRLPPEGSLRPETFATFFGLLICTGLRCREARCLTRADVDFQQRLLRIRQTKFRKSRLVPLHESTVQALKSYAKLRDDFYPLPQTDAFFVSLRGTLLAYPTVHWAFDRLRQSLTWRTDGQARLPRLHDFRHTFACQRLLDWYCQGVDVHHAVALLATYLGHVDINYTYWYLTGTPELLERAGTRFEQFAPSPQGDLS